jgi:uncharacterized protein (UPF0276 family)
MPANRFNGFTNLGIGIGLRVSHYAEILETWPAIDWFEIISENFMVDGGRPLEILDRILEHYPVIQHGVSLYFGSTDPYDMGHLRKLKRLVERTKTPFVSDHLCWGSVNGQYTHDLLPMPYTFEAAKHTAERIKMVRDFLGVPICVENISSYAAFVSSQMTEWQFLSEVAELADCGLLLDVNNIFVCSRNHSFDPYEYLHNIPLERVAQIHIAGHAVHDSYSLDTHDCPVPEPVWELYAAAIKLTGATTTLLEWDAHIPPLMEVHDEALKAARFLSPDVARQTYDKANI